MSILVYVLNILLLAGLIWGMQRQKWAKELAPYFYPALGLKLVCGVLLGVLYTYYYHGGDTTAYHEASLFLAAYAKQNTNGYLRLLFFNTFESEAFRATVPYSTYADFSNSFYFIKLLSVLNHITAGFYYLNAFYLSLFSFWGAARLTAALIRFFPQWRTAAGVAVVAFLFFPSIVFWSAGLSKDALMFGSMCWIIAFGLSVAHGQRMTFWQILLLPLMLYVFIKIRLFYSAVNIPLLLLYISIKRAAAKTEVLKQQSAQVGIFLIALAAGLLLAVLLRNFLPIDFLLEHSTRSYYAMLEMSLHGPHLELEGMERSLEGMAYSYPEALLSAVYRPFLGEAWAPLYVLLGLENLLLLFLTFMAFASVLKRPSFKISLVHVLFLFYVLFLGGIVGLTTPNFGTLSRYRIVFLPFLVYLLLQNRFAQRLLHHLRL